MPRMIQKTFHRVRVFCSPPRGFESRGRAGRRWPAGMTEDVVDDKGLAGLQGDTYVDQIKKRIDGKITTADQKKKVFNVEILETFQREVPDDAPIKKLPPAAATMKAQEAEVRSLRLIVAQQDAKMEALIAALQQGAAPVATLEEAAPSAEVTEIRGVVASQEQRIEELSQALADQSKKMDAILAALSRPTPTPSIDAAPTSSEEGERVGKALAEGLEGKKGRK